MTASRVEGSGLGEPENFNQPIFTGRQLLSSGTSVRPRLPDGPFKIKYSTKLLKVFFKFFSNINTINTVCNVASLHIGALRQMRNLLMHEHNNKRNYII